MSPDLQARGATVPAIFPLPAYHDYTSDSLVPICPSVQMIPGSVGRLAAEALTAIREDFVADLARITRWSSHEGTPPPFVY